MKNNETITISRYSARMIAEETHKLQQAQRPVEPLLTIREAAEFLQLSVSYIYHHIREIPHVKVGRVNRFTKTGLTAYVNRSY